jgi:hypothetical protein
LILFPQGPLRRTVQVGMSKTTQMQRAEEETIARMTRELQSEMADLVAAGEMTDVEANEWVNRKTDQWALGLS